MASSGVVRHRLCDDIRLRKDEGTVGCRCSRMLEGLAVYALLSLGRRDGLALDRFCCDGTCFPYARDGHAVDKMCGGWTDQPSYI